MKKLLSFISIVFIVSISANTQEASDTDFKLGLYLRDKNGLKQIEPSAIVDKNINTFYFEKPAMTLYISGEWAKTATRVNKPEFFFFMPDKESKEPLTTYSVAEVIKNYPFVYASSPMDFVLVRFFDMKQGRAFRLKKEKYFSGVNYKAFDEDKIEYSVIPMPEGKAFKVELIRELPPGEYGFLYNKPTPYDVIIYDFRIE